MRMSGVYLSMRMKIRKNMFIERQKAFFAEMFYIKNDGLHIKNDSLYKKYCLIRKKVIK